MAKAWGRFRRYEWQYSQSQPVSKRPSLRNGARAGGVIRFTVGLWVVLLTVSMVGVSGARADLVLQTSRVRILHTPALKPLALQIAEMSPDIMRSLEIKLGLPFDFKPTVVPAPDRASFIRLGGRPWFTAFAVPHKRQVVLDLSRLNQRAGDLYATLKHEYAHLLLHRAIANRRLPRWLDEGVAQWVSDGLSEYLPAAQRVELPQAAAAGRLFFLAELSDQFPVDQQGLQLAYEQSRSFINYMVRRFGEDALRLLLQLLASGAVPWEAFEEAFGIDPAMAEDDWRLGLRSPGSWIASLAAHVYGLLFFTAAMATIWGYLRFRHRKHHYRDGEDEDPEP